MPTVGIAVPTAVAGSVAGVAAGANMSSNDGCLVSAAVASARLRFRDAASASERLAASDELVFMCKWENCTSIRPMDPCQKGWIVRVSQAGGWGCMRDRATK